MGDFDEITVDEEKIVRAIRMEVPLIMTTYTLPKKVEKYIEKVVSLFLEHIRQMALRDNIIYCIQELVVNAKKANTKRVYFTERGLDLAKPEDYTLGMESFREDTLNNINYYLELQRQHGLYVKLILQLKNDIITVEVRNNSTIAVEELERIRARIKKARKFDDIEDAMIQLLDDSEGAGLGLLILVVMMKKLGLQDDSFDILRTNQETIARIIIPKVLKKTG
jgi:RNA binding exosome subunit